MRQSQISRARGILAGLCILSVLLLPVTVSMAAGKKPSKTRLKKPSKTRLKKPSKISASPLRSLSWRMLEDVFHTGTSLVRELLIGSSKQSLRSLDVRTRLQWNASSLGRFAKAYQYYIQKLSEAFPGRAAIWTKWSRRTRQMIVVAKLLRESALEGKKKAGLDAAVTALSKWKNRSLGSAPSTLRGKRAKLVLNAISGLSTGIEFTSFYRLQQIAAHLKTKPGDLSSLRGFLGSVKRYRRFFRRLHKAKSEKWMGLFVYHSELLFRSTVYLGRSSMAKGTKKIVYTKRYKRYVGMLEASLKKANQSFAKFWRKAK